MALPNSSYSQLTAISRKFFIPKLIDNVYDSNTLFARIRKKKKSFDGGTKIVQPLLYAKTSAAGSYNGADTLNTTDNDQNTAAEFDLKQYYASINITRRDELLNQGKAQVIDLVRSKVENAEKKMADQLGDAIFNTGTTANELIGLRLMCQGTGYTYGSISKTTYSWWRGQVDSSTTTVSLSALGTQLAAAKIGNDKPSVMITTDAIFEDVNNLLQPQQRYQDPKMADAGFRSLMVRGIPILEDSHCPDNHLFMLNEDYIHLYVHPKEDFRFEPFRKPTNQNVSVAQIFWMGALTGSNCRMQAMFTALA